MIIFLIIQKILKTNRTSITYHRLVKYSRLIKTFNNYSLPVRNIDLVLDKPYVIIKTIALQDIEVKLTQLWRRNKFC